MSNEEQIKIVEDSLRQSIEKLTDSEILAEFLPAAKFIPPLSSEISLTNTPSTPEKMVKAIEEMYKNAKYTARVQMMVDELLNSGFSLYVVEGIAPLEEKENLSDERIVPYYIIGQGDKVYSCDTDIYLSIVNAYAKWIKEQEKVDVSSESA